jgi:hypothetical protein
MGALRAGVSASSKAQNTKPAIFFVATIIQTSRQFSKMQTHSVKSSPTTYFPRPASWDNSRSGRLAGCLRDGFKRLRRIKHDAATNNNMTGLLKKLR